VNSDRDKGVVTLGGHVAADGDKSQAESIARSIAGCRLNTPSTGEREKLSGTITWRWLEKELPCHSGFTLSAS
jgi:hypothetical protein